MTNETNTGVVDMSTPNQNAPEQTDAPARKFPALEEMNPEQRAAYDKMSAGQRMSYLAQSQLETGKILVEQAKAARKKEIEDKKTSREFESGVKQIIKDIKEGTLENTPEAINPRIASLKAPEGTVVEDVLKRIQTDAAKTGRQSTITPVKPAFELTHSFAMLPKSAFIPPTDGGRPDNTLANNIRAKFGMIEPLLITADFVPQTDGQSTLYRILDGKRRYFIMEDAPETPEGGDPVEAPTYPAVIVTGFPDEATLEQAEVAVNRIRSLNVLATSDAISRMRLRGVKDAEIRSSMGFKTGEVEKLASITTSLTADLRLLLKDGKIAPAVALNIAKLPANLQGELFRGYQDRSKDNATARISEADVDAVKQQRAKDAVKRDAPELSGLANSVEDADGEGENLTDNNGAGNTASNSPAPDAQNAPETPAKGKKVAEATPDATDGVAWQEGALETLSGVRDNLPQDAGADVWTAFKELVDALDAGTGYAVTPETSGEPTVKVGKKTVENVASNRKDWKAKTEKILAPLVNELDANEAPDEAYKAYDNLKTALANANPSGDGSGQ